MSTVALDCEMVTGIDGKQLLARVSIVDQQGSVLLDEHVKITDTITDYKERWSGIKREHLEKGKPFEKVKSQVSNLISGKILVGHSLHNDLDALGLPRSMGNQRDLAKYKPYMTNGQSQSLKILAQKYLNKSIQEGKHDSVTDAQVAMQLYVRVAHEWNSNS